MNRKIHFSGPIWITILIISGIALLNSCQNQAGKEKLPAGNANTTIKDDTLKGFMLAGVYFVQGYGGAEKFFGKIKADINKDTSHAPFLTLLDTAYRKNFIYPFPRSASEKADSRNTLSSWFQINNQNDFYLFLNNLKDSGFQAHYLLCRKVLDANGGAKADIAAIDLTKNNLPEGSEVLLRFVKDNYSKFSPAGIKAWNTGLYVYAVCLGYGAAYTDEKNGKNMIVTVLRDAEKNYTDWKTYFSDFMLGRGFAGVAQSENIPYQKTIDSMMQGHYSMYTHLPL